MTCKKCGTAVEDGKKFCPTCGNPMAAPEAAAPAPEPTPAPTPAPAPEPTAAPAGSGIPNAAANPFEMPQGQGANVPPYDPTVNPVPPVGQPPKKKKKTGLIVALILIPILLILIVVGVIVGIGVNLGTKAAKNNDAYWNAHINCDGEALAELCPDSFWDYISDTYDLSEEDAVAAMNQYMQDYSDTLGGDLSYKMEQNGVTAGMGNSAQLDPVREDTDKFGLKVSTGVCIDATCTVTGADDSDSDDYSLWTVKIDGKWCSLSAMDDFDQLCGSDYAASAKYIAEFGDMVQTYWNAVVNADAATMSTLVPESWWELIDAEYGVSQSDAESYLTSMLEEMVSGSFGEDGTPELSVDVTGGTDVADEELTELNDGLETYGMAGDAAVDVSMTVKMNEESNDTYLTMTQIDGQWYVYDAMYSYATACYNASQSVG